MTEPDDLRCDECSKHIGWYYSSQPRGGVRCDDCHELEVAAKNEQDRKEAP